jgi:hypothetical protein
MMVAVGFNPRFAAPPNTRRVATVERSRHATRSRVAQRRKPLAIIDRGLTQSLRDTVRRRIPMTFLSSAAS